MAFRPVLELAVTHAAVAGGALPGTAIVPDAATAARLAGLRWLARPAGVRLVVLAETDEDARPLVPPRAPVPLGFVIDPLPAETDRAALAGAPVFTDRAVKAAAVQQLRAGKGEGPARIAVRLTATQVGAAVNGRVRRCAAALPVATARWCYHVVTDHPAATAAWRIVRGAGASGPAPAFAGATAVAATDADDPAGVALLAASPGATVLRFLSDAPVAAAPDPVRGLELRVGDDRLVASLPNPPPDLLVRVGGIVARQHTVRVTTV